jgi:hypothetical protein
MPAASRFDRFVTAVHRRAVLMRVLEGFGAGIAVGAGCALFVILISLREGVHWLPLVFFGAFPAVMSAIAWWQRRPSRLAALIEADRQLKLDDLLSTAFTAKDDDFGRTIRAMAERACARVSPSQVMVNRFGARAWGGVGLAWATVVVLGLLASNGTTSRAGDQAIATGNSVATRPGEVVASSAQHQAGAEHGVDEPRSTGSSEVESSTAGHSTQTGSKSGDAATGSGGGQGETQAARVGATESHTSAGSPTSPTGEAAGGTGVGQAGTGPGPAGGLSGGRVDRSAAPWRSDHWSADRSAALQSVRDGRVPDGYRDLVRDYFERDEH